MSLDPIRRIISGKKARYTNSDEDLDLDLVQLTDRVTLMGYPATGSAALYRNRRSEVIRYLSLLPSPPLIINLCPRYENSYASSALCPPADRVVRFPFPDHYPPPLSLLPVAVDTITKWMKDDPQRTMIIHCKAGKGRSGTMALSYLLTLPDLPSAPSLQPISDLSNPSVQPIDPSPRAPTSLNHLSHIEKLDHLLQFHTERRMAPGTKSRGVSIASQRRWLAYWSQILDRDDPRSEVVRIRKVRLEWIRITGEGPKGLLGKIGGEKIAIQVFHYRPSISSALRKRELALSDPSISKDYYNDDLWDDEKEDMIQRVGGFSEGSDSIVESLNSTPTETPRATTPNTTAPSSPREGSPGGNSSEESHQRTLYTSSVYLPPPTSFLDEPLRTKEQATEKKVVEEGIILNADEGIQFKLLLGKSGRKHGNLPAMAALGIIWFIPSFEAPFSADGRTHVFSISSDSIDFLKPQSGIDRVGIGFTYLE